MQILAIFTAALAAFVLGFLWYGPVFGKLWITLKEIPQAEVDAMKAKGMQAMLPNMIGNLLMNFLMAGVLLYLFKAFDITTLYDACLFTGLGWAAFIVPSFFNAVLWEDRKLALYVFDIAYYLVVLTVMAAVLLWLQ